jgi:threonine dehydratase
MAPPSASTNAEDMPAADDMPTADDIARAREAVAGVALRTPLVRLGTGAQIYLKLENLQPIGSFKLRGAAAVLANAKPDDVAAGVVTASAGNMGQGAAWFARRLGVPCTVVVPPTAPAAKIAAMEALGARVLPVSAEAWWDAFVERRVDGVDGVFIHAFDDPAVMAGNATIGVEIAEDLPGVTHVLVPWGGGGLSCGIAAGLASTGSRARVYACEAATAAPLAASLAAGAPATIEMQPSFVDGIGSRTVLPSMFHRATRLGIGSLVAPVNDIVAALRLMLERNRVLAEGAGATPLACALAGLASDTFTADDVIVCIVSGGVIGLDTVMELLAGPE